MTKRTNKYGKPWVLVLSLVIAVAVLILWLVFVAN